MQNYLFLLNKQNFLHFLEKTQFEYISETSWAYKNESPNIILDFWQDEKGKNHLEQFCEKVNGKWFRLEPTEEQLQMMFALLNNTPYKPVEAICETEEITDWYSHFGVQPSNFF